MNDGTLVELCRQVRIDVLDMVSAANSGHIDSSFSVVEILVALYFGPTQLAPAQESQRPRDRVVLSKGHASAALYSILARRGYFPPSELARFRSIDSHLQGHPRLDTPGVDAPTGSLGQGLSIACGMAWYSQYFSEPPFRAFAILGDGDLNEGQTWEAFLFAGHKKLNNLVAIIDQNGLQFTGKPTEILKIPPLDCILPQLGWEVTTVDGHDLLEIQVALSRRPDRPYCIVAHTVKGKGVRMFELQRTMHGKIPSTETLSMARRELG